MTHHTHTKGDIGVAKVTTDLIEKGFNVFFPFHSFLPFDIIGYKDEISYRIQVKYKKAKNSVLQLSLRRTPSMHKPVPLTEVDIIAVYSPDTNKCYYLNYNDIHTSRIHLLLKKAKSWSDGPTRKTRYLEDYTSFPVDGVITR